MTQTAEVTIESNQILTPRLRLRKWHLDDAAAAVAVYGSDEVTRWLAPAMNTVPTAAQMKSLLSCWKANCDALQYPAGRWAIELRESGDVIGGAALLPLPPYGEDLGVGWQLAPQAWGMGLASEAGHAVAHYAFSSGAADEVFAVVRRKNARGCSTAKRVGMEWVGETEKYYNLRLQVYRLRKGDLDIPT
ncbi:GNAT family N-acetyltransferase [Streptomyces sp. NPDC056227]|uniref:GNAT family N-acetyltransferase n=1 Tax=Streptomyces sp. NPDC056227 TaxID=3345753 RepID=UPI0035DAEF0C